MGRVVRFPGRSARPSVDAGARRRTGRGPRTDPPLACAVCNGHIHPGMENRVCEFCGATMHRGCAGTVRDSVTGETLFGCPACLKKNLPRVKCDICGAYTLRSCSVAGDTVCSKCLRTRVERELYEMLAEMARKAFPWYRRGERGAGRRRK